MISNPCNWFINGNETDAFTYEGGDKLYHFSSVDSKISSYFSVNVVFFANSEEHALDVITRMFKLALDTHVRYETREDINCRCFFFIYIVDFIAVIFKDTAQPFFL